MSRVHKRSLKNQPIKLFRLYKRFLWALRPSSGERKIVLFVVGTQRSGTNMLIDIFTRDYDTKVYREHSNLSSRGAERGIRLNPLPEVKRTIDRDRPPLVVLKPLVETQNLPRLLALFPRSLALWMYRHYTDTIMSSARAFGPDVGIRNLRSIVEGQKDNWRSEVVPDHVRKTVLKHFSESMDPYDARALFWFVRQSLFFDLNAVADPRVRLCKYEALVTDPAARMRSIYAWLGRPYPGDRIVRRVHAGSIGGGKDVRVSPEIREMCDRMMADLDKIFAATWGGPETCGDQCDLAS